jgi:S1/P1 Nuclease
MMLGRAIVAGLLFLTPSSALAWSAAPHEAIAETAQGQLTPAARAALARILQDTDTLSPGALASVATWPDDLRARARHHTIAPGWGPADIEEADQFNADHPSNAQWHFVDLPLGASGYPTPDPAPGDPLRPFVSLADIVHAMARCIAILEAPSEPNNFTKRQAVRWLVHLVGDLHQPLHVTSGYYNTTLPSFPNTPTRINDPVKAAKPGVLNDRGGNGLLFSASESNNLHSLWDRCLPGVVSGASCSGGPDGFTLLAAHLTTLMTPSAVAAATTSGDHHGWPAAWATDSLQRAVATNAFPSSLKQGGVKESTHGDDDSVLARISAPTKNAYTANHVAAARAQLLNAAIRLAVLLNAINWPQ